MSVPRILGGIGLLAVVLGAWLFVAGSASQAAGMPSPVEQATGSRTRSSCSGLMLSGIEFAVEISGFESEQEMVNGVAYDVVTVAGFGSSSKAGSPQVPGRRILLGIPLGADYHLRVSVEESETAPGQYRLLPAPTPLLELDPDSTLDPEAPAPGTAGWEYVEDERAYSTNAFYPQAIARVAGTGFIRDQRYVAVQVNPVQYNPVSGEVILHKRFTVEIDFTYERGLELGTSQSDGSFEPVLSASLLNYESAANWRGKQSSTLLPASLAETARDAGTPAFKIMVNEDGIYQVTAADLAALGIPVTGSRRPRTSYPTGAGKCPSAFSRRGMGASSPSGSMGNSRGPSTRTRTCTGLPMIQLPCPLRSRDCGCRPGACRRSRPPADISTYYSTTVRLEEDHLYRSYMPWAGNPSSDPWIRGITGSGIYTRLLDRSWESGQQANVGIPCSDQWSEHGALIPRRSGPPCLG